MCKRFPIPVWLGLFSLVCTIRIVHAAEEELGRRYAAMTRTLDVLEPFTPEVPVRDLMAVARLALAKGDAPIAKTAMDQVESLHLNYAAKLLDPPIEAEPLRNDFSQLPKFYAAYEEWPRRTAPDRIFTTIAGLPLAQRELPLITADEGSDIDRTLFNESDRPPVVWRMIRHRFTLPGKPVKAWIQVYSRGWNYYVNGRDLGWYGGGSCDCRFDITADLRQGENLLAIADAHYDRFLVVRGGVLLENGRVVTILSGRGTWQINSEQLSCPMAEGATPGPIAKPTLTWQPAAVGGFEGGNYPRPPLYWLPPNLFATFRTTSSIVPWLRPAASGTIRALFATPYVAVGESVEMAAHFDMQLDTFCHGTRDSGIDCKSFAEFANRPYDLMVVGNMRLGQAKDAILRKVRDEGMGLLIVTGIELASQYANALGIADKKLKEAPNVVAGVPMSQLYPFRDNRSSWTDFYEVGKGRVAILGYPAGKAFDQLHPGTFTLGGGLLPNLENMTPYEPFLRDYYYAYLGRISLWAARREGEIRCEMVGPQDPMPLADFQKGIPFHLHVTGLADGRSLLTTFRVRDGQGRQLLARDYPVAAANGVLDTVVSLQGLPPGMCFVDCWLKQAGRQLA
jgi:hypothetical protein